jgi:hypothetical protein
VRILNPLLNMPRIYYTAGNYHGQFQNLNTTAEQNLICRKLDLYRAMITVGNPSFLTLEDIRRYGLYRAMSASIFQKVTLVRVNIASSPNGMHLHPIFENYLSDHKRMVSYNLGMAVAKVYAEKLLNIPNLLHVESLKKVNAITFVAQDGRNREPDLVGKTENGDWHVFEAKGTSQNYLGGALRNAKIQAQQVERIHGIAPTTLTACATSFSQDRIVTRLEDPPSQGKKEIEIDESKFYDNYYAPFFALRESTNSSFTTKKIDNLEFSSVDLKTENLNLTIGIDREVYELIQEKNYSRVNEYYSRTKNIEFDTQYDNQISIGMDGFIVKYMNH